jgi:hypothetical protein
MYSDLLKGTVRHQARAVLLRGHKFIRDVSTGGTEMFDVKADPEEKHDLSKTLPRERAELADLLEGWEREVGQHASPGARSGR